MTEETALAVSRGGALDAVRDYGPPLINIAAEKERLDNFREFVRTVLDPSKGHYGKMPGVDKDFLQQPGAEIIYRAFEAKVEYEILDSEIRWDDDFCYFNVKARVVHVTSKEVLGEATGACSSLEYASNCYLVQRKKGGDDDIFVECPLHGRQLGRSWWDKSARARFLGCPRKIPQGLDRTLQNVESKANKRAMVGAIRTVGCVSEMFTQDEELVNPRGGGDEGEGEQQQPAPRSNTRGQKRDTMRNAEVPSQPQEGLRERLEPKPPAELPQWGRELLDQVKSWGRKAQELAPLIEAEEVRPSTLRAWGNKILSEGGDPFKVATDWLHGKMEAEKAAAAAEAPAADDDAPIDGEARELPAEDVPAEAEATEEAPTEEATARVLDLPFED